MMHADYELRLKLVQELISEKISLRTLVKAVELMGISR